MRTNPSGMPTCLYVTSWLRLEPHYALCILCLVPVFCWTCLILLVPRAPSPMHSVFFGELEAKHAEFCLHPEHRSAPRLRPDCWGTSMPRASFGLLLGTEHVSPYLQLERQHASMCYAPSGFAAVLLARQLALWAGRYLVLFSWVGLPPQ